MAKKNKNLTIGEMAANLRPGQVKIVRIGPGRTGRVSVRGRTDVPDKFNFTREKIAKSVPRKRRK